MPRPKRWPSSCSEHTLRADCEHPIKATASTPEKLFLPSHPVLPHVSLCVAACVPLRPATSAASSTSSPLPSTLQLLADHFVHRVLRSYAASYAASSCTPQRPLHLLLGLPLFLRRVVRCCACCSFLFWRFVWQCSFSCCGVADVDGGGRRDVVRSVVSCVARCVVRCLVSYAAPDTASSCTPCRLLLRQLLFLIVAFRSVMLVLVLVLLCR